MTKIKDYIRGDTRPIAVNCVQSDRITPIDLTGATVYFTLNSSNAPTDDTSAVLQKTDTTHIALASGVTPNNTTYTVGQNTAALGVAWVKILPADTTAVTPGTYYYDVQLKDASGNVTSLDQDTFTIKPDITRTTA